MSKISFLGQFQYNCGSSNALNGYIEAGKRLGHDVRVSDLGYIDNTVRKSLPVAPKDWNQDLLVIVYESYPFLSEEEIELISEKVPREKRIVLDQNGMSLPQVKLENDQNHSGIKSQKKWQDLFNSLSDTVLMPIIGDEKSFYFYGIDSHLPDFSQINKDYDILYLGNNWYRWHDIKWFLKNISSVRKSIQDIALIGWCWDSEIMPKFEEATYSEPELLEEYKVDVLGAPEFGHVEETMSRGKINPIFLRPVLNELKFATARMFETFCADTVPVIPPYFSHARELYGDEVLDLMLEKDVAGKVAHIIENYEDYQSIRKSILLKLKEKYSYEALLNRLLEFIK